MPLNIFTKNFKIPTHNNLLIFNLSGVKILVLSTSLGHKYLTLPYFITLSRNSFGLKITFDHSLNLSTRVNSIVQIENWLRSVDKLCRGKLILKGLGYKANLLLNGSRLNLKLGYSHPIGLDIPTDRIRLKVIKNVITVKGHNLAEIGDFARKIRRFRAPDAYKGKGVWQKNEHKVLKELRKK
jgi:hypothetical protein